MRKTRFYIMLYLTGVFLLLAGCAGGLESEENSNKSTEADHSRPKDSMQATEPVFMSAAGLVSYEFCEQIAQYYRRRNEGEENFFFLNQVTICDYDKDGYAEAALSGQDGPYSLVIILDQDQQNPYVTQYRGVLPKPYWKKETKETVYLGLMQYWVCGDYMTMGVVELGSEDGLQAQYPAAASLRSGYISGGFQHFGYDVYTDCTAEDFELLQMTICDIDQKKALEQYHSTFYSGMEFGDYRILLQEYTPQGEESAQLTVNYPCCDRGEEDNHKAHDGQIVSPEKLYEILKFSEPVSISEPFDFTLESSENIRSINDVQPDESRMSVTNGSRLSYLQCLRAVEYIYSQKSQDSFRVTLYDDDRNGWNELYLYRGKIEDGSISGIVIRENGTQEEVILYKSKDTPSGLDFHGEYAASLSSYLWYYQEYRDAETVAKEIYLMLTNTDT